MINAAAMIFGYIMFCSLALFCLYVLYITIRDHFAEKKKAERKDIAELREEVNHMKHDFDELFNLQCQMIRLRNLVDSSIGSTTDTKNTDAVMEDRKEVLTNERISDEHEGQDR